jgi:hypothetical protein
VKLNRSLLRRGDYIALAGGLLLAISVFVKAYEARPENPNARFDDGVRGTVSVWEVQPLLRILLLLAALAPFILAWIIVREHELSWSRGEMTAVVAIAAIGLIFYNGVIDRPGEPSGQIELEIGWYGMLLGAILMLVGSVMRSSETEVRRKPPGVL